MTEVEYGGGGHRTRLREQLMCYGVPPAPVYKGGEGGGRPRGTPWGEETDLDSMSNSASPFLLPEGERGKEREDEKERGARPLP